MEEERMKLTVTEEEEEEENIDVSNENQTKSTEMVSIKKGGIKTMPFIIVNEALEKVSSYGLMPNMILYLMNEYHLSTATGGRIQSLWSALSNFLSIFGAFISDSYLGRFRAILLGSISSLLGMTLLWLTTMIPQAKPPPCDPSSNICKSPTPTQLAVLLFSFGFMSIGSGCIRPCSMAFGADQLIKKDNPKNEGVIDSYFNWYYASIGISTILSFTVLIYIQDNLGWKVGFGVPAGLMFLSALFFLVGSSFYIQVKVESSLLTKFAQVFVAAFKNRHLALPDLDNSDNQLYHHHSKDTKLVSPSDKLRFLNKACIIRNPEDLNLDGSASKPWELCTVDQVEVLKSLIRIIPICSTSIIVYMTMGLSITVIQAKSMDRQITSTFQIPPGSFPLFTAVTLTIWVVFYDRVIVPQLTKYTGHGINPIKRMGIGSVLSCITMAVGAIVESIRRRIAIQEGFSEDPSAVVNMSALWLVPQFCLSGLAEAFNAIGQIEFCYTKIPKSMSSIAAAIVTLGNAVSGLLGSVIITIVDNVTKSGGKVSWLSSNLNKGHYDYYYWLMFFLSLLNFIYFLGCCWAYGPFEEESRVSNEAKGKDLKEGLLSKSRELPSSSSV